VSEVPRLRASALDALRGVYERQHDWQQALDVYRQLLQIKAAPSPSVAAHYLCELAGASLEREDIPGARRLLEQAAELTTPFPRADMLRAQIAEREGDGALAVQLLRSAMTVSPTLLQEQLPHLLRLTAGSAQNDILEQLVSQAESRDLGELKRLVFAAISAGLSEAPALRGPIEKVFSLDPTLQAMWQAQSGSHDRAAQEIGALLAQAEKYRCNECGFSGRSFYWHCPACHSWDSFEAYAIVKLR
jgi:lipopolysaccharide biosynthesis regulator YciM